jgi:hypothetical protein
MRKAEIQAIRMERFMEVSPNMAVYGRVHQSCHKSLNGVAAAGPRDGPPPFR